MSVQDVAAKIKFLEQRLEAAKHDKARTDGRIEELMSRMKAEFGVETVEEAEAMLTKMQSDIAENGKRVESMFARMRDVHGWEV